MAFRQTVDLDVEGHDPITVEYTAVDLRAWEREHDRSALVEVTSLNMITWLGWHAAKRQGLLNGVTGATWTEFDAVCTGVTTRKGRDAARPTKRTRSGDS